MRLPERPEPIDPLDRQQAAAGYHCTAAVNFVVEELLVTGLSSRYSYWLKPSIVIRCYDDERWTLAETEWR